jgi:hypothetical protein
MQTNYYTGAGLGLSSLGRAADSLGQQESGPLTVTLRPTGAMFGVWWSLSTLSGLISAYHGYRRNNGNLGWTLAWFVGGSAFPVIVPVIAFTQGYAKPAMRANKRRRRSR